MVVWINSGGVCGSSQLGDKVGREIVQRLIGVLFITVFRITLFESFEQRRNISGTELVFRPVPGAVSPHLHTVGPYALIVRVMENSQRDPGKSKGNIPNGALIHLKGVIKRFFLFRKCTAGKEEDNQQDHGRNDFFMHSDSLLFSPEPRFM